MIVLCRRKAYRNDCVVLVIAEHGLVMEILEGTIEKGKRKAGKQRNE